MTKPTMDLVEEYGAVQCCLGSGLTIGLRDNSNALLSEIRQRLEAMERDAARYRWLRGEVEGPHVPMAQVVWKLHCRRQSSNWTNLADGLSLDEHIDAAMAEGEAKP